MDDPRICRRLRQMLVPMVKACTPDFHEPFAHHRTLRQYMPTAKWLSLISRGARMFLPSHSYTTMPFLSSQQSSWKNGYLLGHQSDDEDSDVFDKSGASLPERRSSIPRLLLICTVLTTCYSILITAALGRYMVRSKYAGSDIIYSKLCEHF